MSCLVPLVAVVAVARNGAIGRDAKLPWTMPSDLARFRVLTMGKPMIMGRRTFESIGKPLPGRESIVVSGRTREGSLNGAFVAASPGEALTLAARRATVMGASNVVVIGGAAIFEALMGHIDRIYLTLVDLTPSADTFFALPGSDRWREVARYHPLRDPRDEADSVHLEYERA